MVWDGFLTWFFLGVYARIGRREKRLSDFLWRTYQGRAEIDQPRNEGHKACRAGPAAAPSGFGLNSPAGNSRIRSGFFFEKACCEAVA